MSALIEVILPVFLIIGAGYISVWSKIITESGLDGLMNFAQKFALPCLLFAAISRLDLGQEFDLRLLSSFYIAAIISFTIGLTGARMLFNRSWEDSVAIGFVALFSNSLLLGVPITERAYGSDALAANFAIISVHSPICYGLGITAMEIARARKSRKRFVATVLSILRAMFSNALVLGIALGFVVNLTGLPLPGPVWDALDLMIRAALPLLALVLSGPALAEPILLAGAPRAFAILNGTLAGAIGLGLQLWVAGIVIGLLGHLVAVWAARRDPLFVEVGRRHLRLPGHLEV